MSEPTLNDLRRIFYGAGADGSVSDAEYAFLQSAETAGISAADLLALPDALANLPTVREAQLLRTYSLVPNFVGFNTSVAEEDVVSGREFLGDTTEAGQQFRIRAAGGVINNSPGAVNFTLRLRGVVGGVPTTYASHVFALPVDAAPRAWFMEVLGTWSTFVGTFFYCTSDASVGAAGAAPRLESLPAPTVAGIDLSQHRTWKITGQMSVAHANVSFYATHGSMDILESLSE